MIGTARELTGIKYEVSPAEEISSVKGLEPNSVDLLTVAMAVSGLLLDIGRWES